jgi:hypothetical protein
MNIGEQVKINTYSISKDINKTVGTYINLDTSLVYEEAYLGVNTVVWVLINEISREYEHR